MRDGGVLWLGAKASDMEDTVKVVRLTMRRRCGPVQQENPFGPRRQSSRALGTGLGTRPVAKLWRLAKKVKSLTSRMWPKGQWEKNGCLPSVR